MAINNTMTEEGRLFYNGRECNDPGTKRVDGGLVRLDTKSKRDKSRCSGHDAKLKSSHVAFASTPSKTLSGTRGYWRGASTDDVFITWRSLAYGVGELYEVCQVFG